jgi:putative DNA primase/helicase
MVAQFPIQREKFDIRYHLDHLEPTKQRNKYICPACGGHNLSIDPETGAYQCWNGCECEDIREAIRPWSEVVTSHGTNERKVLPAIKGQVKVNPPLPLPVGAKLVLSPSGVTDCPSPQKPTAKLPSGIPSHSTETIYHYSETQWVTRYQWEDAKQNKGYDKTFRQWHRQPDGTPVMKKGDRVWYAYRLQEAIDVARLVDNIPALLWQEGEKVVELARSNGIASLTLQGSDWAKPLIQSSLEEIKNTLGTSVQVFLTDSDKTGREKGKKFQEACTAVALPCLVIDPSDIYPDIPEKGDLEQILNQMDVPEFIRRLEAEIHKAAESQAQESEIVDIPNAFNPDVTFLQQAYNFLYGDKHWISADDKLYFHDGTYYQYSPDSAERPRIANFCKTYAVADDKGEIKYPFAKPSKVREVLQWAKDLTEVDPELLNPIGINCTNGVVRVRWEGNKPSRYLESHTPQHYYIYKP